MEGYGPSSPELVIVAEAPAHTEDSWCQACQKPASGINPTRLGSDSRGGNPQSRGQIATCVSLGHQIGQPLVGQSGVLLKKALSKAGIHPDKVFYTNVVRCAGPNPTMLEARKCKGYILDELLGLDYVNCRGVVLLGQVAVRSILNDGRLTIKETRMRDLTSAIRQAGLSLPEGVVMKATYHPAAALPHRSPELFEEIVHDLMELTKERDALTAVTSGTSIQDLTAAFPDPEIIGIDLEWRGDNTIRMIGLSDATRNVIVTNPQVVLEWLTRRER